MRFRKKPVVIEATQFNEAKRPWPNGVKYVADHQIEGNRLPVTYPREANGIWGSGYFIVFTLEGPLHVSEGDWILTGIKGEKYPCKDEIFRATYEREDGSSV